MTVSPMQSPSGINFRLDGGVAASLGPPLDVQKWVALPSWYSSHRLRTVYTAEVHVISSPMIQVALKPVLDNERIGNDVDYVSIWADSDRPQTGAQLVIGLRHMSRPVDHDDIDLPFDPDEYPLA